MSTSTQKLPKAARPSDNIEYVLPLGNGWVVKNKAAKVFTVITDTKKEAITIARSIAKNKKRELVVYGRGGVVELKEAY